STTAGTETTCRSVLRGAVPQPCELRRPPAPAVADRLVALRSGHRQPDRFAVRLPRLVPVGRQDGGEHDERYEHGGYQHGCSLPCGRRAVGGANNGRWKLVRR